MQGGVRIKRELKIKRKKGLIDARIMFGKERTIRQSITT
jgi:hypothetical protein